MIYLWFTGTFDFIQLHFEHNKVPKIFPMNFFGLSLFKKWFSGQQFNVALGGGRENLRHAPIRLVEPPIMQLPVQPSFVPPPAPQQVVQPQPAPKQWILEPEDFLLAQMQKMELIQHQSSRHPLGFQGKFYWILCAIDGIICIYIYNLVAIFFSATFVAKHVCQRLAQPAFDQFPTTAPNHSNRSVRVFAR